MEAGAKRLCKCNTKIYSWTCSIYQTSPRITVMRKLVANASAV
jgi:hypothetical protein